MGSPKHRITLRDIAGHTGYSTNTVSLALRDSERISGETKRKIQDAANALNYLPNHAAKTLVGRRTMTVGLILTNILNPVLNLSAQALELNLSERGYATLFGTSNNTLAHELEIIRTFRSRQVDGMIVYPAAHEQIDQFRALRETGFPLVLLIGEPEAGVDVVSVDERRGGFKATRHLLRLGHRHIGLLDATRPLGTSEKAEGFNRAFREAGLSPCKSLIRSTSGHSPADGHIAMQQLWETRDKPTAVIASNDSLALGAIRWCQENGLNVPRDISVIGFDNIEVGRFASVPLTTVDYPVDAVIGLAVDRLLELIESGDSLPEARVTLIEPELIVRDSTGPSAER